jgi:arabinan endo-1,5-alpha-L-arabinosidase
LLRFLLVFSLLTTCLVAHGDADRSGQIRFEPANGENQSTTGTATEWQVTRGQWSHQNGAISASGNLDNRAISSTSQPLALRWPITLHLQQGWSAGALVWYDPASEKGFAIRLDSRQNKIALEHIGPWPEAKELDYFPWSFLNGNKVSLAIETGQNYIRAFAPEVSSYPILEALNIQPEGAHLGLQVIDAVAAFSDGSPQKSEAKQLKTYKPVVGEFAHVYNPSVGESGPWYINDHTFARADDGWHLVGITHAQPAAPLDELNFAHAKSPVFPGSLDTWKKQPYALQTDRSKGEAHLWAPHIFKRDNLYYMFYCAGSPQGGAHYQINLATSEDCTSWTRHENNPIFQDTFDARDPMILEDDGTYYMYYTANIGRTESHHTVNLRTSKDLVNWGPARIALVHPQKGTGGGETESPYVVKYEEHFYLFIGPARGYHSTAVYRSPNPLYWKFESEITSFPSHAAEVIRDDEGKWYVSGAGWDREGVFVAPMQWEPQQ